YLEEDPGNAPLLADIFEVALACGNLETARDQLEAARRAGADRGDWIQREARLAIACGDLDHAATMLTCLRSASAGHAVVAQDGAHVQALQVLWLRGMHAQHRLDEAWAWAQEARACTALLPAAAGVLALMAVDRSDFASARTLSDEALQAGCAGPEALVARASVALAERDAARAVALLQQALGFNPRDGRTHGLLGMANLLARELATAMQHLEQAVAEVPHHVGTWHALAWARLLAGQHATALQAFEQALALDRNFAESHGAVGLLHAMEGRSAQALRYLALADRLDPTNVTGRYARAWLSGQAGPDRLQALAQRLLDRPGFFGGKLSDAVGSVQSP
ncbi:MAG TPA: tetratricopeptide repeat protein, partial [Ramlibacter sp.]|nr:tetratricopeptide repeat protein [Ramlibacter sp.]